MIRVESTSLQVRFAPQVPLARQAKWRVAAARLMLASHCQATLSKSDSPMLIQTSVSSGQLSKAKFPIFVTVEGR